MPLKHANLATTTITGNINSSVLVIPIASAAKFPTMAAGDYFWAALVNTSNAVEFVLVTGITGLNVTIATGGRGLAGTTATNWVTGDRFELHIIDLSLSAVQQEAHAAVATSGTDTYTATLTNVPQAYIQYMTYLLHVANTNTVTNPTLNINSLGAKTIVLDGGAVVPVGLIPAEAIFRYDGTNMVLVNPKIIEVKKTVASATSPDIWTGTNALSLIDYTGTATATGFAAAPQAGARRSLACASTASFTAGANVFIGGIPSGSTYTALAGDVIDVIANTTTTFKLFIRPFNVSAVNGGFAFPATQVSSAGANVLDDYEEGQYLPTDNSSAGLTLSIVIDYTKIGRMVHCGLSGSYPATADANNAQFSIPFSCSKAGSGVLFHGGGSTGERLFVNASNPTNCVVYESAPGGQVTNAGLSFSTLVGSFTYQAAT